MQRHVRSGSEMVKFLIPQRDGLRNEQLTTLRIPPILNPFVGGGKASIFLQSRQTVKRCFDFLG
jgi:hypothetical protein